MTKYAGIADAHGIESFYKNPDDSRINFFILRASFNRQRHAVAYEIELTAEAALPIETLITQKRYMEALQLLKLHHDIKLYDVSDVASIRDEPVDKDVLKSWDMIPNHKLDPYWSEEK